MEIQTVKEFEYIYLVNGSISIPKNQKNSDYQKVLDFIDNGGAIEQEDFVQKAQDAKIAKIEANKKTFIYLPIEYNGSTFINSEISSTALKIVKDETNEPIEWLDIDNNQVNLTATQATELLGLMIAHRKSAYFQEATLIQSVKACTTVQEVEDINITFS